MKAVDSVDDSPVDGGDSRLTEKALIEENSCLREENEALKATLRQTNMALGSLTNILEALGSRANYTCDVLSSQVLSLEERLKKSENFSGSSAKAQFTHRDNERILKDKILSLESKINRLEIENEAIAILKSQVLVYRNDFTELQSKYKELCRQSSSLKEELTTLNVTRIPRSTDPGAESLELMNQQEAFTCVNPNCLRVFRSESLLRDHVERCLNLS